MKNQTRDKISVQAPLISQESNAIKIDQSRTDAIKSTKRKNSNGSSINESTYQNDSKHILCNSNSLLNINNNTKSSRSNNEDSIATQNKNNHYMIPLPSSNKQLNSENGFDVIRAKNMNQNCGEDRIKIKKCETNIISGNKPNTAIQKEIKVESNYNQKDNKGIHIDFY